MRKIFSLTFVALLIVPAVAWVLGLDFGMNIDRRGLEPPQVYGRALLKKAYYLAFDQYFNDSFNLRSPLTLAKNWLDYYVFRTTDSPDIHIGRNGWLYSRTSIQDYRKEACDDQMDVGRLILELHAIEKITQASGRRFFYIVAPNKSTIYPEFVGFVPQSDLCDRSRYDLFLENIAAQPLRSFVRLDQELKEEKKGDVLLYDKTSTYWNWLGALVAADRIRRQMFQDSLEEPPPDYNLISIAGTGDLKGQLMGLSPPDEAEPVEHFVGSDRQDLPLGIVYGDAFMKNLLPYVVHMFRQLDVIRADQIPSTKHRENLPAYDFLMIEEAESEIGLTEIELDRIFSVFEAEAHIPERRSLDLQKVVPGSHISLDPKTEGLEIKSLGVRSVFEIPSLPGSDRKIFRVLKLSVEASQPDLMKLSYTNGLPHVVTKSLKPGLTEVYLPLPFQESLSLHIHPGDRAGRFLLRSAEILGFLSRSDIERPWQERSAFAVTPREVENVLSVPESEEILSGSKTDVDVPAVSSEGVVNTAQSDRGDSWETEGRPSHESSLTVTDFEEGRIFQRRGRSADIIVSGTWSGPLNTIEARVVRDGTLEEIVPWTVIDVSPQNGIFLGTLPDVPQGGWYNVQVRDSKNHRVASNGSNKWGVGMLVACLGQSNMKEWFYTGTALKAHSLLRKHTAKGWADLGGRGNAAIAFGNMIIERLNIPVGLLDYSKNGSGLREEADWGTGYWEDTARGSIYNRFLAGVSKAEGAVEFVVWIQGEADAARGTVTEDEYRTSLESFITNQVRADVENGSNRAHLPFLVVMMIKRPGGRDKPHQAIRNAQKYVAENFAESYLAATTLDLENRGKQHLTPQAYMTMGRRVAQTVLYILGQEKYYRGPEVAEVRRINDRALDIRIKHRGGTDVTPLSGISGWEVLANGTPVPIAELYRHDPQTIRIVLERPLVGEAEIRYLYGAMPDATKPVLDNSAMSLPLEEYQSEIQ
ncbi:MAG: hypothetical protein GTN81_15390 [Proteobacteria bacterium]|nr:hypothetical protein [Pseudomonadota bacterium]